MQVESESTVELIEYMGGDKAVVNSARVSFGVVHDVMDYLDEGEPELIRFLMRNRHGTPFESTVLTFRVKTPIFVAREWFRHRIGSFNEMSGRYKELPGEFFMHARARTQEGKPGSYRFEDAGDAKTGLMHANVDLAYSTAWDIYQLLLSEGIAKEQARAVLPVGIMTQFYWTVNARSLMNFLELRLAPNAMEEIRDAAQVVRRHFRFVAPVTAEAFDDCGKAP